MREEGGRAGKSRRRKGKREGGRDGGRDCEREGGRGPEGGSEGGGSGGRRTRRRRRRTGESAMRSTYWRESALRIGQPPAPPYYGTATCCQAAGLLPGPAPPTRAPAQKRPMTCCY